MRALAEYLLKTAIPSLINELAVDAQRISEKFHQYGVNMRYLGYVYSKVENVQIRLALERQIVCKSAKHVFRQAMRESSASEVG